MPSVNITEILLHGKETCTLPSILHEALPIINGWTFHRVISAIALVTAVLTLLVSLVNICRHLGSYTVPTEQRQIVRILLTPVIFSIFYFFSLWFYEAAAYLEPVAELYEVFAVAAMFLLFTAFVCPERSQYESFFAGVERRSNFKQIKKHDRGSLRWFCYIWVAVFQLLPTRLICSIVTWTLHAVLCPLNPSLGYANIAISVVESVFMTVALLSIIRFYRRLRPQLKEKGSASKLIVFKIMIGISLTQTPVFAGLSDGGVLKPTRFISFQDWSVGLPAFCTCCEMLIFSLVFLWPFSAGPYIYKELDSEKSGKRQAGLGFFAALLDALNIWDIVSGTFFHNKLFTLFKRRDLAFVESDRRPVLDDSSELEATLERSLRCGAGDESEWI